MIAVVIMKIVSGISRLEVTEFDELGRITERLDRAATEYEIEFRKIV